MSVKILLTLLLSVILLVGCATTGVDPLKEAYEKGQLSRFEYEYLRLMRDQKNIQQYRMIMDYMRNRR